MLPARTVGFGDFVILLEVSSALQTLGKQLCCHFEASLPTLSAPRSDFLISTGRISRSSGDPRQTITCCRTPRCCWFFPQLPFTSSSKGHKHQQQDYQNEWKLGNRSPQFKNFRKTFSHKSKSTRSGLCTMADTW